MFDFLKEAGLEIVLALGGLFLIVLALAGQLSISEFGVMIANPYLRIGSGLFGLVLVIGSIVIYRKGEIKTKDLPGQETENSNITAEKFFFTLDDANIDNFTQIVSGAVRVRILARTVVNLVGQYSNEFKRMINNGCEVQLLIVDPASDAAKYLYKNRFDLYQNNVELVRKHIKELQDLSSENFEVRTISHAPTVSIMWIEKRDISDTYLRVQFYFLHGAVGRDRPIFHIHRGDRWYNVFVNEFDELWKDSSDWS